jgi:hypothetical protein
MAKKDKELRKQQMIEWTRSAFSFHEGKQKIYTILRSVSRSGMARFYDVYAHDGVQMKRITGCLAIACSLRYSKRWDAIQINVCGFSGAQELVSYVAGVIGVQPNDVDYQEL